MCAIEVAHKSIHQPMGSKKNGKIPHVNYVPKTLCF